MKPSPSRALLALLLLLAGARAPLAAAADAGTARVPAFAAAYARLNDADDVLAAVRDAQAHGTADEQGWAANLLSTCDFTALANQPAGLSPAGVQDWQAARLEAGRRCAGVAAMRHADVRALGDALRAAGIASTSALGRLRAIGATPDGLAFRPATPAELEALGNALRDPDPVLRYFAGNVAAGLIEQATDRAHATAFVAVAVPTELAASLGRLDALFACLADGWCPHTQGEALAQAWRTPADAEGGRLQRAYAQALARGASMADVLGMR